MEEINLDSTTGQPTTADNDNTMVRITNAYKAYDASSMVLNGFNMTVSTGTIYGLLGPSGCGKTTLLSCIIGRTRLNSGRIQLAVRKKKQIGYMPQDLALYEEFSMAETLHYFGSLYEMPYEQIITRGEKLLSLMDMPPTKTKFGAMSGGQQRRFSLCVALIHDPSLLILDEPTVGVDLIISASIWTYLHELTTRGKTIIITTHYIEEARRANMIGLMRKGVLLAEAAPLEIMASCNADSLESAFLTLSQKHTANMEVTRENSKMPTSPSSTTLEKSSFFSPTRFKAQLLKHWYWSVRNWKIIFFVCLLPIFTLLLFDTIVGRTPDLLYMGVINKEIVETPCSPIQPNAFCDDQIPFSCKYLHHLELNGVSLIYYDDVEEAKTAGLHNKIWGYLEFKSNFTELVKKRYDDPMNMASEDLEEMELWASMDMSNFIISKLIQTRILKSLKDLSKSHGFCNETSIRYVDSRPFTIMEPVFGQLEVNMSHYGAPAVLSILEFYLTFLFTALAIGMEKSRGLLERSLSSGLTESEVILSQLVVQIIMLIFQTCTVFILQFVIFSYPLMGHWMWPMIIVFLQGICGTFLGFAASISFDDERITTFLGIGIVLTQVFLSGIMWPFEGMQSVLKEISKFLPLTLSIDAFRSMTARNWGIFHPVVAKGFASILIWIFLAVGISILSLKFKQGLKSKK
ncbi:ABC transporter G family member 23-like [Adelges cooleyi]|uniref:ABC transporter G family member 23-like n=1 Tax=Adelges cooleyi TaxID=133065 RepID=UPI00217F32FE|nr:ABC transporter G family member 23-like [Adelges cooleyi]